MARNGGNMMTEAKPTYAKASVGEGVGYKGRSSNILLTIY
jgi:hypothetical protein